MNYKYSLLLLSFLSSFSLAEGYKPWSLGIGASGTFGDLEKQENKTEELGFYLHAAYRPIEDIKLSIEISPEQERWKNEKKCDPVGCYVLNLKTTDILLEASWAFLNFKSKHPSFLSLGAGYLYSDVKLEVEESFRTFPTSKASVNDAVNGFGLNLLAQAGISEHISIGLKISHYWREKFFSNTRRPLGFNNTSVKFEIGYGF